MALQTLIWRVWDRAGAQATLSSKEGEAAATDGQAGSAG